MKFKINRHIGDEVWLMHEDQAKVGIIKGIIFRRYISNLDFETIKTVERYDVEVKCTKGVKTVTCEKCELFNTKNELINSL